MLIGRVSVPPDWKGSIVVEATTETAGKAALVHQVRLHEAGGYELIVPEGRYTLHAFGDEDDDGRPDANGLTATRVQPIEVAGSGLISSLDLNLRTGSPDGFRRGPCPVVVIVPVHSTQVGSLANLAAPEFSAESGRQGYWEPVESFRRHGGNVYFLEPYDPRKIPILFVHGAAGSAQDWGAFFGRLDHDRYQAWFFAYPSGADLTSTADLLYWKLLNLQARYRFERLDCVAHSMGGLVVRRFLLSHGSQFPEIDQFVSISTPWGGDPNAALGVRHSPAVVPSWRDLRPEGDFLKKLFEHPLPASVTYTLLFGYRGAFNLFSRNSDGTVSLSSQLRPSAQAEANLVKGFEEDHQSILTSPQVIAEVMSVLNASRHL